MYVVVQHEFKRRANLASRPGNVASPSRRGGLWSVPRNQTTINQCIIISFIFFISSIPCSFVHSTYRAIDMPSTRSRSTDDAADAPTSKRSRKSTSETATDDVVKIHSRYDDHTASFRLISSNDVASTWTGLTSLDIGESRHHVSGSLHRVLYMLACVCAVGLMPWQSCAQRHAQS